MHNSRPPGLRDWKCDLDLSGTEIHVRPRNDVLYHQPHTGCLCGPTVHFLDNDTGTLEWFAVHHAFDGRGHAPAGCHIPNLGPCQHDDDDDGDDDDGDDGDNGLDEAYA